MKNHIFKLILTGCIFTAFSLCIFGCSKVEEKAEVIPEGFQLITNLEKGFSIVKPVNWIAANQTDDPSGKTYVAFKSPEDAENKVGNLSIIAGDETPLTKDEYLRSLINNYGELFKKFNLELTDTLTIHGELFGTFVLSAELNNEPYRMRTVYTIIDKKLYQINAMSPITRYTNDEAAFEVMINSFKILK
ncbi:hypothetical protein ACFL7D_09245 [candidate division KSB1 bacterium]